MLILRYCFFIIRGFRDLCDLFFSKNCLSCGVLDSLLCNKCLDYKFFVPKKIFGTGFRDRSLSFPIWFCSEYDEDVSRIIVAYKDRSYDGLSFCLAKILSIALDDIIALNLGNFRNFTVVPVPSSRVSKNRRGYDAIRILAERACKMSVYSDHIDVFSGLFFSRKVADQSALTSKERQINLSGSMSVLGEIDMPCIIFDDILTTGSTISEAARALVSAGGIVVGALVLSSTV